MGFSYKESLALPSWLFWAYVEGASFERMLDSIATYEATGLSAHGFEKGSHQQIKGKWDRLLGGSVRAQKPVRERSPQASMSIDERRKLWS